jgi:[ribosomal protein S18]-alanine N-acetyltransferase
MSAVLQPLPELRPMTAGDVDAVVAIERTIYEFPWTAGNFHDSLAAGYSCWIYSSGSAPIGYAVVMVAADEAHLLNLSIAASWQRKGHGARLLALLLDTARGYGAAKLFLEVRPSNAAGQRLYAGHGFRRVGRRRNYYPARDGREDAIILSYEL